MDLQSALSLLADGPQWNAERLENIVNDYCLVAKLKLGEIAQPLRAALTGTKVSPGIFEVMAALGRAESLGRLADAISSQQGRTGA